MGISYNGGKIEPAPFINLTKNYQNTQDGTKIGTLFNINLQGTFLPQRGSPTSSGTVWYAVGSPPDEVLTTDQYLESVIRKQEGLRTLFSQDGKQFQVDGFDGYSYLACNPRVKNIEFPSSAPTSWAAKANYVIQLEADYIYLFNQSGVIEDSGTISGYHIESAEESWNMESQNEDQPLFRLSHSVNAKGKKFYGTNGQLLREPWENAREYVFTKLGLEQDKIYCSGVLNLTGFSGYNYVRSQNLSELGGTFAVNETWMVMKPSASGWPAYEEFDVNTRTDESSLTQVSIQGKSIGFKESNNILYSGIIHTKFYNASGLFYSTISPSLLNRAQSYGGVTLNTTPLNYTLGQNPIGGVISYTIEYNNRPTALITGARSESIGLSWDLPTSIFAELVVLDRPLGPVMQDINSRTSSKLTVNIEAVMAAKTQSFTPTMPDVNSLISGYMPSATNVFLSRDNQSWDINHGRFARSSTWTYSN